MERQYVTFKIKSEEYGVDIQNVQEITDIESITQIPNAPEYVMGIVNIRGVIIPIIDLKRRLSFYNEDSENKGRIIVINIKGKQVGFMIDDASRVLTLDDEDIDLPPIMTEAQKESYVTGIAKVEGMLILILDLAGMFSDDELEEVLKVD